MIRKYMKKLSVLAIIVSSVVLASCGPKDGVYEFDLFSTNDVHGTWFGSTCTSSRVRPSLLAVSRYVDTVTPHLTSGELNDASILGTWKFIPEKQAAAYLSNDMKRLFGEQEH